MSDGCTSDMVYEPSVHRSSLAILGHQKTVCGTEEDPVTLKICGPAHSEDMGSSILSTRAQWPLICLYRYSITIMSI